MCSAYSTSKALPPLSVVLRQTVSSPGTQPIPPPPSLPLPLTSPSTHNSSFAPLTQVLVADNVLPFPTNTADSRSMAYHSSCGPSIQDSSAPAELFAERTSMFPQSTSQTLPQTISASRIRPKRRRASLHQLSILESVFQRTFYPGTAERLSLARQLGMTPRRVQIWFQNQRQKLVKREHELQRTNSTDESDSEEGTQDTSPDKASMDSNDENSNGSKEGSEEEEEEGNEDDGLKNGDLPSLPATTTVGSGGILPMRQEHLRRKGKKPVTVRRPALPPVAPLPPNWTAANTSLNPDNQPTSSEFHSSGNMNNPHNLSVDIPAPLPSLAPASAYPAIPLRSPSYRHRPYDLIDQGANGGNRRRAASLVDRPAAMYSAFSASSPLRRLSENSVTANSKPRPLTPPGPPAYRSPMYNYEMDTACDYPPRARVPCYHCTSNHSPTGHHYHYPRNHHSHPNHFPNLNTNHSPSHPSCQQPMHTSPLPEPASHPDTFSTCFDVASNQYGSLSNICPTASTPPMPIHFNSAPHVMKSASWSPQGHDELPDHADKRSPIHFS